MPQQPGLKGQRGSVLAGVLALSLVITIAASGYIVTTSILHSNEENTVDSRDLMRAGESVAQMAIRCMRDLPLDSLYGEHSISEGASRGITPGYPAWAQFLNESARTALNDPFFRAEYAKEGGSVYVRTWVTYGGASDTAFVSWKIETAEAGGPNGMSKLTLKDWKDTLLAYRN